MYFFAGSREGNTTNGSGSTVIQIPCKLQLFSDNIIRKQKKNHVPFAQDNSGIIEQWVGYLQWTVSEQRFDSINFPEWEIGMIS